MTWTVNYSDSAKRDLHGIRSYIAETLLEPEVAEKQVNRIMDAADVLDQQPFRHRSYDNEPWRSQGLRIKPVDNYVILYFPDEKTTTVTIIRIMHGSRDIDKQLSQSEE